MSGAAIASGELTAALAKRDLSTRSSYHSERFGLCAYLPLSALLRNTPLGLENLVPLVTAQPTFPVE